MFNALAISLDGVPIFKSINTSNRFTPSTSLQRGSHGFSCLARLIFLIAMID
jgi:hypothetical protein